MTVVVAWQTAFAASATEAPNTVPAATTGTPTAPATHDVLLPLVDGREGVLRYPSVVEPLVPAAVTLIGAQQGPYSLVIADRTVAISPGEPVELVFSGPEGPRSLHIRRGEQVIGTATVQLQAQTRFEAGPYSRLFETLRETVRKDRRAWTRKGRVIHTNPNWVRDHIHEMKAFKYWENDLNSFVDALIDLQHDDGFFYEILAQLSFDHFTFVNEKHQLKEPDENLGWIRLELEADIEYLMVEAAHAIWQATGDDDAMRKRLPHLDRALTYCMTDPTRWDRQHGAVKRTFTIDTWDFTYGVPTTNRRIEPGMPMGIMHGDNSGFYQACRQLAAMYRSSSNRLVDRLRAARWDDRAESLRERINRLCFNGRYYTHQILLQPVDTGVKEEEILSLSNAYDINRGLPTHDMAVKILDEYAARGKARAATHFAEWFSIDPPYPKFAHYGPGQYINGGIASFVAGELAKAALNEGREAYGADILRRVARKVAQDGAIYFLYTPDGRNQGGGPSGWGAAAVVSALVEGLAGIRDDATLFRETTVSPRFVAADIDRARVCARYGPSGAYLALDYDHRPVERMIRVRLAGVSDRTQLRVLLPAGARDARVSLPAGLSSQLETIEQSRYLVVDLLSPLSRAVAEIAIRYEL